MTVVSLVGTAVALTSEQGNREDVMAVEAELSKLNEETIQSKINDADEEIKTTNERLKAGIGLAEDNRSRIDELRTEKSKLLESLKKAKSERLSSAAKGGASNATKNPLSRLASILKWDADIFRLVYSAGIMVLLEAGALVSTSAALSSGGRKRKDNGTRYINTAGITHISAGGSGRIVRSLCGSNFSAETSLVPASSVCPKCIQAKIGGTND